MTPKQKGLIRETWNEIVPIADTAAELFYNRLFEVAPSIRPLFRSTDMVEQSKKLIQALMVAVKNLDNLEALTPVLEDLGRRHLHYGVVAQHYEDVGKTLLWTLKQGLGEAWTPEVAAAWTDLYALLSSIMQGAGNEPSQNAA